MRLIFAAMIIIILVYFGIQSVTLFRDINARIENRIAEIK